MGIWERVHHTLRTKVRQADGRQPASTAAILDSQTIKLGDQGGVRGYDAGRKTAGRKRHFLVDVPGLLLGVYVRSSDELDRDGTKTLLGRCSHGYGRLAKIWADAGGAGTLVTWVKALRPRGRLHLDIVHRPGNEKGRQVLHRRRIVERTIGWFVMQRRLVRHCEARTERSEAMIYVTLIPLMLRRLARSNQKRLFI